MKISNCQLGMSKVVPRLPRSVIDVVTDPIHEVVQLPVPKFGVEDRLNLELRDAVHMDVRHGFCRGNDSGLRATSLSYRLIRTETYSCTLLEIS